MERGPLRLQSSGGALGAGKREKEAKDKAQITGSKEQDEEEEEKCWLDKRTPAQVALEKMQEKQQMEGILKKASKTRKERVEEFGGHLDALTEHCNIPSSWTQ
ncbi:LOW QUALITY PROTEIN: protein FAM32A-like [Geothlypis trichas]